MKKENQNNALAIYSTPVIDERLHIYHSGGNHFHLTPKNQGHGRWLINTSDGDLVFQPDGLPTWHDDFCMFSAEIGEDRHIHFYNTFSEGVRVMFELIGQGVGVGTKAGQYLATMETFNFTFQAFGSTEAEAEENIAAAFHSHLNEGESLAEEKRSHVASVLREDWGIRIVSSADGVAFRDGSVIMKKED
jgi:hypothetical protein